METRVSLKYFVNGYSSCDLGTIADIDTVFVLFFNDVPNSIIDHDI